MTITQEEKDAITKEMVKVIMQFVEGTHPYGQGRERYVQWSMEQDGWETVLPSAIGADKTNQLINEMADRIEEGLPVSWPTPEIDEALQAAEIEVFGEIVCE
jgi:hypothetical protein